MGEHKPLVLVCTCKERLALVRRGECDAFEYRYALNSKEAYRQLEARPDVLLCNTQFDEGRVFEFLHGLRRHPCGAGLPVILVHSFDWMTPVMRESIEAAALLLGVREVVDASALLVSSSRAFKDLLRTRIRASLRSGYRKRQARFGRTSAGQDES